MVRANHQPVPLPGQGPFAPALSGVHAGGWRDVSRRRRYAIENGPSGFEPQAPAWLPKAYFLMLMRNERLAALQTRFEDHSHVLTIRKGGEVAASGDLETAEGRDAIERLFTANFAPN